MVTLSNISISILTTSQKVSSQELFLRLMLACHGSWQTIKMPSHIKRKQINRYVKSYLRQSKKKRVLIVKWKNKTLIYSN